MIDVSELMNDPDFATSYNVIRRKGSWVKGRFQIKDEKTLKFYGPVQAATTKDLEQLPEGDRERGIMKFFCSPPNELFISHEGEEYEGVTDIVEYRKSRFKIIQVSDWNVNGYCRAFGVKMG